MVRLLGRVQRRQFGVWVSAAKLGVGHQRPLPVQFGGGMPSSTGLGDLRQGLPVGADLLCQCTAFLCLPPGLRPFGLVDRGVRPIPRAHRVGPVGVLREVRLPELLDDVRRRPPGLALVRGPAGPQLAVGRGRDLPVLFRHPQRD